MNLFSLFFLASLIGFLGASGYNFEDSFSEEFSYSVTNPDFDGKPASGIVNEKTNKVYVTDFFAGKLVILDGETNKIIETIDVVRTPFGVGVNPNTDTIYVGGEHADTLSILNCDSANLKQVLFVN